MIKITRNFKKLANEHKDKLNKDYAIEKKLDEKIKNESAELKQFYQDLKDNLDCVLSGEPNELRSLIDTIDNTLGCFFFEEKTTITDKNGKIRKTKKLKHKKVITDINSIFDYKAFCKKDNNKYNAYDLTKQLNINVCPYCNRQYISTLMPKNNSGSTRPTLDHFYLKSKYPYLALSFYNLIPSCYCCNSQLRGTKEISLHPYEKGFEGILHFYTEIESIDNLYNLQLTKHKKIEPNPADLKQAEINSEVFQLNELYQQNHIEYVKELTKRVIIYDALFSKGLKTQFGNLFSDDLDARNTMLANHTTIDDLEKRPLAKLTKDICEELGITL